MEIKNSNLPRRTIRPLSTVFSNLSKRLKRSSVFAGVVIHFIDFFDSFGLYSPGGVRGRISISSLLLSDENNGGKREYSLLDRELVWNVVGTIQNDSGSALLHIGVGSKVDKMYVCMYI